MFLLYKVQNTAILKSDNGRTTPSSILWGIAKTLDMFVSLQVFGNTFTDNTCSYTMDDINLSHIIKQGLVDKDI